MEDIKRDIEIERLNEYCISLGMKHGVENLCFMWRDDKPGFREWLLKRGYNNLGTDEGVLFLIKKYNAD